MGYFLFVLYYIFACVLYRINTILAESRVLVVVGKTSECLGQNQAPLKTHPNFQKWGKQRLNQELLSYIEMIWPNDRL